MTTRSIPFLKQGVLEGKGTVSDARAKSEKILYKLYSGNALFISYACWKLCLCFFSKGKIVLDENSRNTNFGTKLVIQSIYTKKGLPSYVTNSLQENCQEVPNIIVEKYYFLGFVYNNFVKLLTNNKKFQIKLTDKSFLCKLM